MLTRAQRAALMPLIIQSLTPRQRESLALLPADFAWLTETSTRRGISFYGLRHKTIAMGIEATLAERDHTTRHNEPERWRLTKLGALVQEEIANA